MNSIGSVVRYRAGVDIGGTFTDVVFVGDDGRLIAHKVPSTPDDFSRGILDGLTEVMRAAGIAPGQIAELVHGTTVATNAILEHRGARTALMTTAGFRDVLELRRVRMPQLYNIQWEKPAPLVPRHLRFEVAERVDHRGAVLTPLDETDVRQVAVRVADERVDAVAVCLINAYANPVHEQRIGALLQDLLPGVPVSLSSEISRELKEFERTSTTTIDAYVKPTVDGYLQALDARLRDAGITARLLIMQSNGAVMSAAAARAHPCFMIESGPAAGVIGGQAVARAAGEPNVITFDMGGTTAKAAMIERGEISLTDEYEVGAGITIGSRLMKGDGYLLRIPAIDLAEVGAGGGSVAWVDAGGHLQVGPRSAGAVPGPACYGLGNDEPTITDANVVLGYIHPETFAGGRVTIDPDLSWRALERLGRALGLPTDEAAFAVHVVSNARMSRPIQAVSTERGRDVREFALLGFGGSGPIHAAHLAQSLGMRRVIVPPHAGLFSAIGLVFSPLGHQFVQTFHQRLDRLDDAALVAAIDALRADASAQLAQLGYAADAVAFRVAADARYVGQSFSLRVDLPDGSSPVAELAHRFQEEHLRSYGHRAETDPVEIVNLRLNALLEAPDRTFAQGFAGAGWSTEPSSGSRSIYVSREQGFVTAPSVSRESLVEPRQGPLTIDEEDTTILVPPSWCASLDSTGNVLLGKDE